MPKQILVVDDEPYIGYLVKMVLERRGYKVILALDANEAMAANRANHFNLFLLDIAMPGMNGIELCERLQNACAGEVPFIMLTARGDERTKAAAWESGASEFVTKPFSPKALQNLVAEIIGEPADGES